MHSIRFLLIFFLMSCAIYAQTGNLSNKDSIDVINKITHIIQDKSISYLLKINEIDKLSKSVKLKDNEYIMYLFAQSIAVIYFRNNDFEKAFDYFDISIFIIDQKHPNLILKAMLNAVVTAYKLKSTDLLSHALNRYTTYCFNINKDVVQICYILNLFQLYKDQGHLPATSESKIDSMMLDYNCKIIININQVKPDSLFLEHIFY